MGVDARMDSFIKDLEFHHNENTEAPEAGKKIWRFVKESIISERPDLNLSRNGITSYKKKKALDICESMREILDIVSGEISHELYVENLSLIQEAAITIGNSIESSVGTESAIIKALEEICEDAYILSVNRVEIKEKISLLLEKINRVKHELNNIPDKLSVIFLPYKFSMWDSLESVWIAASNDPEVETIVAPIPYVERNDEGEAGNWCYEIDKFAFIPDISIYNEINLEEIHPDAVFIHNPYDGANFVTSVHPDYYSSELRKKTDCLCYIPYNLFGHDFVFPVHATTPGVFWAKYVFLQSEKVAGQFISHFREFMISEGLLEFAENAEKKFLNFGSPKVDKLYVEVLKKRKLPEDWQALIGEGENRKKVLFFNSHLSVGMKKWEDVYRRIIQNFLDTMENNPETVAIWRPHPLSEQTIKAMNPDFLPEYMEFKNKAKEIDNIILDETDDMYTGLLISDGFYGDYASLGQICSYLNIPVLEYS